MAWCEKEGFSDLIPQLHSDTLWMADKQDSIFGVPKITHNNPTDIRKQFRALEKQAGITTSVANRA